MNNLIRLANIDLAKIDSRLFTQAGRKAAKFVSNYKVRFLASLVLVVLVDDIIVHIDRKREQKAFEESAIKMQIIVRKHEAQINILRSEVEQAQEITKMFGRLEQILKKAIKGDALE